jgi:hypothetical protein
MTPGHAALDELLQQVVAVTRSALRACEARDPDALHRALDMRSALLVTCQQRARDYGSVPPKVQSTLAVLRRLDADLDHATRRLKDEVASELAAATRAKTAVADYLTNDHPSRTRLDRAL